MDAYRITERNMKIGIILGLIGMVLWAYTIASLIINIACIHCSIIGLDSRYKDVSFAALILGIIGLVLTLFRGIIVL